AIVARHRAAAAVATRWLWGTVPERPRYRRMRSIFLRGLGAVYLAAFWSLGVQVDGLIGSRGILPAREYLSAAGPILGSTGHWQGFRLMFLSGVVKLTSGDPAWRAWRALEYHYETQPLPTWTSWYMHQLPPWFQTVSVGYMFWAELIAPFLVFGPRRLRMVGF